MLARLGLLFLFTACWAHAAFGAPLPQPAHVVTTNVWDLIVHGGKIVVGIGLLLFPTLVAFYRKDRDALERLLRTLPDIWAVVQQERRKAAEGKGQPVTKPLERGVELATESHGKPLSKTQAAAVRIKLKAIHEREGAPDVGASPSGPTILRTTMGDGRLPPK